MTKEERLAKEEALFVTMTENERKLWSEGYQSICGIDEVGRGPLAGPVVTAAVVLPKDFDVRGIKDSKQLSEKKREKLFDEINEKALAVGIGMEDNMVIDEINILNATKSAMKKALAYADRILKSKGLNPIDYVIIDAVKLDGLNCPQLPLIKGDQKSISVAAASIIAKVTRDRLMVEYDKEYPDYKFASNKGYGTKDHYAGIEKAGITPIHRRSFLKKLF